MPFEHDFLPRIELSDAIIDGKRYYDTPKGTFKSVTTLIGEKSDKTWAEAWRARVGDAAADEVMRQAATRGTAVHELAEKYVMNDVNWMKGAMPFNVVTFRKIKKVLDETIDLIYGVEYPLFSSLFKTAGRTDLPARFRGIDTVVDFKTSKRLKQRSDIPGYFTQATVYGLMLEELTGKKFTQVAVIVAVDDEPEAQVFVEKCRDWYPEVKRVFIDQ